MPTKQEFISKIKTKYPDYANIEDNALFDKIITKYPEYKEQITDFEQPMQQPTEQQHVLTGGVEQNVFADIAKGALSGAATIPRAAAQLSSQYLRPLIGKEPLSQEQLNKALIPIGAAEYKPQTLLGGVSKFGGEVLPILPIKAETLAAQALLGGGIGATEAASRGENILDILGATALGAGTATGISKALPVASKLITSGVLKPASDIGLRALGLSQDIVERATRPGARAFKVGLQNQPADIVAPIQQYGSEIAKELRSKVRGVETLRGRAVGKAEKEAIEQLGEIPIIESKQHLAPFEDYINSKTRFAESTPNENRFIELAGQLETAGTLSVKEATGLIEELDSLIDYRPSIGQRLSPTDKKIQLAAKKMRNSINTELKQKLGKDYAIAKERYAEISKYATPKSIMGEQETTETLISNLFRKDVPEATILNQLSSIGGASKGEQTKQLINLLGLLKKENVNIDTLNKLDDFIAAQQINKAYTGTGGIPVLSSIAGVGRAGLKPLLPLIQDIRTDLLTPASRKNIELLKKSLEKSPQITSTLTTRRE